MNGFAVRTGVTPGEEPVTLTLRPGGRVLVRVIGPDGQPVKDAWPRLHTWDGLRIDLAGVYPRPSGAPAAYEVNGPAGTLEFRVGGSAAEKTLGSGTVTVRPGETANLEIKLRELPQR